MFRRGQKVICVDISGLNGHEDGLQVGAEYTIRHGNVEYTDIAWRTEPPFVYLEEIHRDPRSGCGGVEAPFMAKRFRPVQRTDISIFTAMLTPKKKKSKARA